MITFDGCWVSVVSTNVQQIAGGGFVRLRRWSDGEIDHLHIASSSDDTPAHGDYDPHCAWCWLGIGHSTGAHTESIDLTSPTPQLTNTQET